MTLCLARRRKKRLNIGLVSDIKAKVKVSGRELKVIISQAAKMLENFYPDHVIARLPLSDDTFWEGRRLDNDDWQGENRSEPALTGFNRTEPVVTDSGVNRTEPVVTGSGSCQRNGTSSIQL